MLSSCQNLWHFTAVTIGHLLGVSTLKPVEYITAATAMLVLDFGFGVVSRFQIYFQGFSDFSFFLISVINYYSKVPDWLTSMLSEPPLVANSYRIFSYSSDYLLMFANLPYLLMILYDIIMLKVKTATSPLLGQSFGP